MTIVVGEWMLWILIIAFILNIWQINLEEKKRRKEFQDMRDRMRESYKQFEKERLR